MGLVIGSWLMLLRGVFGDSVLCGWFGLLRFAGCMVLMVIAEFLVEW